MGIFSANNLPTCWNLLSKFARFCGVLTSVASPLARALYLARTIFLPARIFSANLHAFVVFSPPFRLHLPQLCQMEPKIFPLDAITPETKNWTAKVSILNKTEPRTSSQPASIRFQKLLLADNKSTAAIIIDSHPPRTVMAKGKENTLHEYAAIDELLNPFIITFWNDAAADDVYNLLSSTKERHIIAALNFSVSDYHNISLSSKSASVVLIKSNIERVRDLQKWGVLCIHKERIDVLQQQGDVSRKAETNFGHDTETFTSIETLLTTEQVQPARLRKSCSHKSKLHLSMLCQMSPANNCSVWFRFSLLVYDESGEIEVTIFGDEGEKLMQMSANDFMNQYCNNEPLILDSINSNLHQLKLKMKIQSKVFNEQDGTTTMSHTMQTPECHQLASSASPAGIANVLELSASQKNETTSLPSTTKEHPRSDIHPNTSSRGRASKAKKTE
ncbi:hypothetical protein OROMI_016630 [Orobanche minor]